MTTLLIAGSVSVQTVGGPIQAKPSPAVVQASPQAVQRMIPSGGVDLRPKIAALGLAPRNQAPRPTCTIFATTFLMEYGDALAGKPGKQLGQR